MDHDGTAGLHFGNYEVHTLPDGSVHELGRGGFSRTLLARHVTPGHIFESMWFVIGAALLLVSGSLAFHVYRAVPGFPLRRTLSRWKSEVQELKEHAL